METIEVCYQPADDHFYARLAKNQSINAKGTTREGAISTLLVIIQHIGESGFQSDYEIKEISTPFSSQPRFVGLSQQTVK